MIVENTIKTLVCHRATLRDLCLDQQIQAISLSDFMTLYARTRRLAAELLKAGAGFALLSQYCKAMSRLATRQNDVSSDLSTDIELCKAVVLAGYAVTAADRIDLNVAELVLDDAQMHDDEMDANIKKLELRRWLDELQSQSPPRLLLSCRIAIHCQLSVANGYRDIRTAAKRLPLAETLQEYLLFRVSTAGECRCGPD